MAVLGNHTRRGSGRTIGNRRSGGCSEPNTVPFDSLSPVDWKGKGLANAGPFFVLAASSGGAIAELEPSTSLCEAAHVKHHPRTNSPPALDTLRESFVFGPVPFDAQRRLANLGRRERFEIETVLCAGGEHLDVLRFIQAGTIRPVLRTEAGAAISGAPMACGMWATWPGVFCEPPVPHDLVASPGTECLAFPASAVRETAIAHPEVYRRVIEEISAILRGLMTLSLTSGYNDDERSLARAVLAGCRAANPRSDGPVVIEMTQEQIGRLGFGSRQRVARLLRSLASSGILEARYGQIIVPSQRALEAYLEE